MDCETDNISMLVKNIAKNLKVLKRIPPTANWENKVKLSTHEIKWISKETGIEEYKIYMKYG